MEDEKTVEQRSRRAQRSGRVVGDRAAGPRSRSRSTRRQTRSDRFEREVNNRLNRSGDSKPMKITRYKPIKKSKLKDVVINFATEEDPTYATIGDTRAGKDKDKEDTIKRFEATYSGVEEGRDPSEGGSGEVYANLEYFGKSHNERIEDTEETIYASVIGQR